MAPEREMSLAQVAQTNTQPPPPPPCDKGTCHTNLFKPATHPLNKFSPLPSSNTTPTKPLFLPAPFVTSPCFSTLGRSDRGGCNVHFLKRFTKRSPNGFSLPSKWSSQKEYGVQEKRPKHREVSCQILAEVEVVAGWRQQVHTRQPPAMADLSVASLFDSRALSLGGLAVLGTKSTSLARLRQWLIADFAAAAFACQKRGSTRQGAFLSHACQSCGAQSEHFELGNVWCIDLVFLEDHSK